MKIEPKFFAKDNKLFFLDGTQLDAQSAVFEDAAGFSPEGKSPSVLYGLKTPWSLVGTDADSYNEEFLASLRDALKSLEESSVFVFIVPVCDAPADSDALAESMRHCARRIKDCESVAGFFIPAECDSAHFIEEISAKHKHYVFFSNNSAILKDNGQIVKVCY